MEEPIGTRFGALPSRYEETKPALDQIYAHGRILDIGGEILDKFQESTKLDRENAAKESEKMAWKDAEKYKDECVAKALKRAQANEEIRMMDKEKKHAEFVKSEIARMARVWDQHRIEAVFDERKAGEKGMRDMAEELRKKYDLEKMAEVKAARIEERALAQSEAERVQRQFEHETEELIKEMDEAKLRELDALTNKLKNVEKENIRETVQEERQRALKELEKVNFAHRQEIDELLNRIDDITGEKVTVQLQLDSMTEQRDTFIHKYEALRLQFTEFIEQCRPDFSTGQSDFLLPPNVTL